MAYHDALFQLGMDLTRSSTAQKEDHGEAARVARQAASVPGPHEDRREYVERDGVRFAGDHLIIDLVDASRLDDLEHVERTLKRCVEVAGATLLGVHLHRDAHEAGVSGFAVLAGSHIGFHSSPSAGYAAVDVYMRGEIHPRAILDVLQEAFGAREAVVVKTHRRGPGAAGGSAERLDQAREADARKQPGRQVRRARAA